MNTSDLREETREILSKVNAEVQVKSKVSVSRSAFAVFLALISALLLILNIFILYLVNLSMGYIPFITIK